MTLIVYDDQLKDREITFCKGYKFAQFATKFLLDDDKYSIFALSYDHIKNNEDYETSFEDYKSKLKQFLDKTKYDFDFNKPIATL